MRTGISRWIPAFLGAACLLAGCASSTSPRASGAATGTATTAVSVDSCPSTLADGVPSGEHVGDVLEPLDADKLLVCGYRRILSQGVPVLTLAAHSSTADGPALRTLQQAIDALPEKQGGSGSCPNDTGNGVLLLVFSAATGSAGSTTAAGPVVLRAKLTGCPLVTNGRVTGGIGASAVGTSLMALLPQSYCSEVWPPAACAAR